jgi:hypothetical protein
MISARVAKWVSGFFFVLSGVLFAAMCAYAITRPGSAIGADGETISTMTPAEAHTVEFMLCSTLWSFCIAFGVRVVADSSTTGRALLRVLQPIAFAVILAAPLLWYDAGIEGPAIAASVGGIATFVLSKFLYFVIYGAKETVELVKEGIAEFKDQFVLRSETQPFFLPPASFLPEGPVGGSPLPVESSPPAWTPPPTPVLAPTPTWSPPPPPPPPVTWTPSPPPPPAWTPPPPVEPPPARGSTWQ